MQVIIIFHIFRDHLISLFQNRKDDSLKHNFATQKSLTTEILRFLRRNLVNMIYALKNFSDEVGNVNLSQTLILPETFVVFFPNFRSRKSHEYSGRDNGASYFYHKSCQHRMFRFLQ